MQLSSIKQLDPQTVLAKSAVISPQSEVFYFRKGLVAPTSVKFQAVEGLFYTPATRSVDTGQVCCLYQLAIDS